MDSVDQLLSRGIASVLPTKEGLADLMRSKKITLYQGFDPTGTQLHIGHMVALRKLREFQDLGHTVIFLIGDGTGQAGDPSGKKATREHFFSREELRKNAEDYVRQASKIVRFDGDNPVKILYNGDWLNELKLVDILEIAQNFSVQQLLERDMFQERIKNDATINLREFLYPLLQGYDSVAMSVDLEVGGTDQTFNMLAGRTLVKNIQGREKYVLSVPLLSDAKGNKIGKSEGNVIGLTDHPTDFYAKIMALGDDAIIPCFTLLTDLPMDEVNSISQKLSEGSNPMEYKKQLAFMLTTQLHSKPQAQEAQNAFEQTFQKGEPTSWVETPIDPHTSLVSFLSQITGSTSEAKRLLAQKAVDVNGALATDPKQELTGGEEIKIGKRTFIKTVIK